MTSLTQLPRVNVTETESRRVAVEGGEGGVFNGDRVSVWEEAILERDGGEDRCMVKGANCMYILL